MVAHPEGEPEAQIIRDLLEGEGIHVMVRNRDAATAQSGAIGPAWAYEVWVMRKDLARARELIGEDDS